MDAGAVTGLAIGIDGAAVPDSLQRIDARLHHVAPSFAVQRRHQPDATGIVFLCGVIGLFQTFGVRVPSGNEILGGQGHGVGHGKVSVGYSFRPRARSLAPFF